MTRYEALRRLGIATHHRHQAIDEAVVALAVKEPYRSRNDRGYSCDGANLYLSSRPVALWHAGAVRIFHKHLEYCPYMLTVSTIGVRQRLKSLSLFAETDERVCFEHDDCIASPELGVACSESRWTPPKKPYFDRQVEQRRLRAERSGRVRQHMRSAAP